MESTNLNIRTDKAVKTAAEAIFEELGLNMTTAVNMFLRQTIRENGIPFALKLTPNDVTAAAIAEGRALAHDKTAVGYTSMDELKAALAE
jgi:DNA-damage-inducible protein J